MADLALVLFLVLTALAFDFINGFHDAANAISTIVSTRVLTPSQAVLWAAFFNFVAFFLVGVPVATTIGTGIIQPGIITDAVIFAALAGAIAWNLITWYLGLPSSSSHPLIGGLIGTGLVKGGVECWSSPGSKRQCSSSSCRRRSVWSWVCSS
jgi:PiT family inorganic phosphate transporter